MSVTAMSAAWELELPHAELLVLMALADHADLSGHNIHPSVRLTAWKTGYEERQVRRIIAKLVEKGILVVEQAITGEVKHYSLDFTKGKKKLPFVRLSANFTPHPPGQNVRTPPDKMSDPHPCQNVRTPPDISVVVGAQNVRTTPDIAMSYKSSVEPSVESSVQPSSGVGDERGKVMDALKIRILTLFGYEDISAGWTYLEQWGIYEVSGRPNVLAEMDRIENLYRTLNFVGLPKMPKTLLQQWMETYERSKHPEREKPQRPGLNELGPDRNKGTLNTGKADDIIAHFNRVNSR